MNKIARVILIVAVLAAVATVWDGFYIVPEGEQAVVTQFGAPVGQPVTEAGLHFKKPFIQEVSFFDKKILIWDGDPNQVPTKDKTFVFLDVTARWRIADALTFLRAVNNETRAQTILDDVIGAAVRDLVNKNNLVEIIRSSDWQQGESVSILQKQEETISLGRDKMADLIYQTASKATGRYGIELVDVMFKRVNYIETVRQKVYERMISERKRIAAEKRSKGEGKKAEILGKVDRELKTLTSTARQKAEEIKGRADAEATRIYAEAYKQDPEFYAFFKTLETYEQTFGGKTTLVIDSGSPFYQYLNKF